MESKDHDRLIILPADEFSRRLDKVRSLMSADGIEAALICDNADIYYMTGRVFCGFIFITADGFVRIAVRRPSRLKGDNVVDIHKIEDLPPMLPAVSGKFGLELSRVPYLTAMRYVKAFGEDKRYVDITPVINRARAVKTDMELEAIRLSGVRQTRIYNRIPHLYEEGMRDIDLQIEIERASRLEGCLGQFRVSGQDMELFMGNVLVGENADTPSPYDFAMGGAGMDPSLPVGANGTLIRPGLSVMVDVNGNYTGYMTDMTRCFYVDALPERALAAHQLSIDICDRLADMGRPGVEARALYEEAESMARNAGFEGEFMGHNYHAGFVGHGVGIEINELPVIAPRSKSVLETGNVIALEPKFVIPGVGAVGIEDTYIVCDGAPMQRVTDAPRNVTLLE